ncbi:MAG: hypothetical protein ACLQGP_02500 [Isosphaeraceae bacterium]
MRCDEVIRELAVPTGDRDQAALAEHLAGCPSCVAWNRRAAMLDQLWDATRPAEPSPEAWDSVWANLNQALPSTSADHQVASSAPNTLRMADSTKVITHFDSAHTQTANHSRTQRFVAIAAMVGLAQAAAILIAMGLAWQAEPGAPARKLPPIAQNPTPAPHAPSMIRVDTPVVFEADIEEGHLMKFRMDGPKPERVDVTPPEMAYGIGDGTPGDVMYVMFNRMESIATPMVASQ